MRTAFYAGASGLLANQKAMEAARALQEGKEEHE